MEAVYIILIIFSILVFIGITIGGAANAVVKKLIKTYADSSSTISKTASEFCKNVLVKKKIDVQVARIPGSDNACYDYQNKVIALSDNVYSSYSQVYIAMAAHETGHAIQDAQETAKFRIYKRLNIGSKILTPIFWLAFFTAIILLIAIPYEPLYSLIAFAVMGASMILEFTFKWITVSMEKQASKFAIEILQEEGFTEDELYLAQNLYKAALTTYISGVFDPVIKIFNAITWVIYHTIGRLFR